MPGSAPFIESMMVRKSAAEVALISESASWCEHAHRLLQQYSVPGATEAEASLRAGHEATLAMLEALGASFGGQQGSSDGASAGYRGQIGLRSAWAHAVAHNIVFQAGDVLVTETARADLGLPRRARAGDDHRPAHRRDAPPLRPHGRRAAGRVRGVSARRHLRRRRRRRARATSRRTTSCRSGSSTPATRSGCATTRRRSSTSATTHAIEPGMVFTIEPGVYAPDVGGFRHSDTILVTEDGDRHPHRLPERHRKSLTIPASAGLHPALAIARARSGPPARRPLRERVPDGQPGLRLSTSVGAGFHPARDPGFTRAASRRSRGRRRRAGYAESARRPARDRPPRALPGTRAAASTQVILPATLRRRGLDRGRRPRTSARRHRGSCRRSAPSALPGPRATNARAASGA